MNCKLASNNVRRSIKDYTIYFITLMFGVCIFYIFNSIKSQSAMLQLNESKLQMINTISKVMDVISVFIAVVLGFLILYANKFLIRRRKKELGIYLTLGMDKKDVSFILVMETLIIGFLSLIAGIILGIIASQGMSVFVASLFEVNMENFKFVFSASASIKSILYFEIIYIIVMLLNIKTVSKCRLIDLIYGDKHNEAVISRMWLSVILFIFSLILITMAYAMIIENGLKSLDPFFYGAILFGSIGTFMFFISVSDIILKIASSSKMYLKNLNMFVVRQLSSKIKTAFASMAIICLMLSIAIITLSSGFAMNKALSESLKGTTPFDVSILTEQEDNKPLETTENILKSKEIKLSDYTDDQFSVVLYKDSKLLFGDIAGTSTGKMSESKWYAISELSPVILSMSDYNKIQEHLSHKKITLNKDQYLVISSNKKIQKEIESFMSNNGTINVFGSTLKPVETKIIHELLYTHIDGNGNDSFLVVSDNVIKGREPVKYLTSFNYKSGISDYSFDNKLHSSFGKKYIAQANRIVSDDIGIFVYTKASIYGENAGIRAMITFIIIYIAFIFLLGSAVILALQQLTEAEDNKKRYTLLSEIGADRKMLNKALFTQIGIYFLMPLIMAVIHSSVGLYVVNNMIPSDIGSVSIPASLILTAVLFVMIYGGYFIATYIGSKNIIKK